MIIYGKQVCLYALEKHEALIKTVYIAKKGILPQKLYQEYKSRIKFLENKWAQSMAKGGNHQGILIEIEEFAQSDLATIKQSDFVLVFDGLTDSGNIGAIVRTAFALGVDGVIATGVKSLNLASVVRTSSGALLDMPFIIIPNTLDVLNELKQVGFRVYGASMDGTPINRCQFTQKKVLVLGSEGEGISKRAKSKIDEMVSIEMKREFDSLNVSVAAGILIDRMRYAVK
ncbi:MAG: 23S rRNA (guanosine(2251)-2'-O)-methyltransferase RlmB [Epsilonproteobacteria bacterium]|nr:23S rRNA (guanosine(2251)-2'-O)-methyltransferase RlmB [Campylobacterota bacterium]